MQRAKGLGLGPQCYLLLGAISARPMTSLEIWQELGIARAGARVYDLRAAGFEVSSELVPVLNRRGDTCRVARYAVLGRGRRTPRTAAARAAARRAA